MSLQKVIGIIKKYDKFLITSHINLEGDAICSQLALLELIKKMKKNALCVDNDKVSSNFDFLPGIRHIKQYEGEDIDYTIAMVLDCPTLDRAGSVRGLLSKAKKIVNIDHHISNDKFGDVNWVSSGSSSVGEMIYTLYKELKIKMSKEAALCIYISILTDTGSFNYSNTSGLTHRIASEILELGIKPEEVSNRVYENKSIEEIKLLGSAINSLETVENDRIAVMVYTKDMLKKTGCGYPNTENFINIARSIKNVDIAIFIKEHTDKENEFNISLRSKGNINVNKLASFFGGGGHKNAAGCIIRGTLAEVRSKIILKAKEVLKKQRH